MKFEVAAPKMAVIFKSLKKPFQRRSCLSEQYFGQAVKDVKARKGRVRELMGVIRR